MRSLKHFSDYVIKRVAKQVSLCEKTFILSPETLRMVFIVIRVINEEGGRQVEEEKKSP